MILAIVIFDLDMALMNTEKVAKLEIITNLKV